MAPLAGPLRLTEGMTRPGARLRFGQKAIVPIRQYHPLRGYTEGVLGIVVRKIQHVPGSEIDGNFDDNSAALLKKNTAYYATIVITNESGNPMSLEMLRFDGLRSDGELASIVLIGGDLPNCRTTDSPDRFDHAGARWVTCKLWVSSPSRPIRKIRYREPPYGEANQAFDDARFNRYYSLGMLTWS
ncbi:hypothetical protein [Micromonospora deserti]|uniref:DUF4352 domain-containing protein n=1 Tax=Micromonospora deserti TaxID=2070366 RepID=A0A2W2DCV5_9ACTN|nr:hypothetical protein [Micromonospora deserti]PZG03015.1 hypothetical protein C1I99_00135 [Micromonospora deserti]